MSKKIIHCQTKEGPIWREETAEDKLFNILHQNKENFKINEPINNDEYNRTRKYD